MKLGGVASVDELPVYVYQDQDGDQVALPCTERLFSEKVATTLAALGVIPVVSVRGRPEVRLASFAAVGGKLLAGRWAPATMASAAPTSAPTSAPVSAPASAPAVSEVAPAEEAPADTSDLDALLASLDAPADPAPDPQPEVAAPPDDDLDALLASLNAPEEPKAEDATEDDLDALLASLK